MSLGSGESPIQSFYDDGGGSGGGPAPTETLQDAYDAGGATGGEIALNDTGGPLDLIVSLGEVDSAGLIVEAQDASLDSQNPAAIEIAAKGLVSAEGPPVANTVGALLKAFARNGGSILHGFFQIIVANVLAAQFDWQCADGETLLSIVENTASVLTLRKVKRQAGTGVLYAEGTGPATGVAAKSLCAVASGALTGAVGVSAVSNSTPGQYLLDVAAFAQDGKDVILLTPVGDDGGSEPIAMEVDGFGSTPGNVQVNVYRAGVAANADFSFVHFRTP